jgi:hypothetical protein
VSTTFQLVALPAEQFAPLFDLGDAQLQSMGVLRVVADEKPGFPCRVSLVDAEVGETTLLLSFTHHDVSSPYRATGPIFVRRGARTARPAPGEIPLMFRHRLLSVRAYDAAALLIGAEVAKGTDLEAVIARLFTDEKVRYLHVHNAGPGCYNCCVVRA